MLVALWWVEVLSGDELDHGVCLFRVGLLPCTTSVHVTINI